jgi:hypothetical protein
MYAIRKGREAVAPGLGGDPAAAPRLDWRLPRSEQAADQFGSLPEPLLLGRSCRGGKFSLDFCKHPRQRHGERVQRSFQIGGRSFQVLVIGFRGHNPRAARAPGARNASQERADFFPSRVFYPSHSRPRSGHDNAAYLGGGSRL